MTSKYAIFGGIILFLIVTGIFLQSHSKVTDSEIISPTEKKEVESPQTTHEVQTATSSTSSTTQDVSSPQQILAPTAETVSESPALPEYTTATLALHNGDDPTLPIYLAYESLVYDITAGREYYEPGGVYHYFAGTDATTLLNMIGGDIIKRKYKVVGTFTP